MLIRILSFLKRRPKYPVISTKHLGNLFETSGNSVLDIGARGGTQTDFLPLAPFAKLFLVEADKKEAQRLIQNKNKPWKNVTVIPLAIGSQKTAQLFTTLKPGLSSLMKPNREVVKKLFNDGEWKVVKKTKIKPQTLDQAAQNYHLNDISVIKLDTQGTELDILKTGSKLVLPTLLAISIEIELQEIYKNQPLFTEVHRYIHSRGFELIDLKRSYIRRKHDQRLAYSKRELTWFHCLYFRSTNRHSKLRPEQLLKLITIAISLEYFDYAISLLKILSFQKPKLLNYPALVEEIIDYAGKVKFYRLNKTPKYLREKLLSNIYSDRNNVI